MHLEFQSTPHSDGRCMMQLRGIGLKVQAICSGAIASSFERCVLIFMRKWQLHKLHSSIAAAFKLQLKVKIIVDKWH